MQALAVLVKFPDELQSIEAFCESEGSPETITLVRQLLDEATKQGITNDRRHRQWEYRQFGALLDHLDFLRGLAVAKDHSARYY